MAGLRTAGSYTPSEKALRDLRRRLGAAPLKSLFEVLADRWHSPGLQECAIAAGARLPSTDAVLSGSRTRNETVAGWDADRGAGYPIVQLMTLCETGTRGLLGAVFGPTSHGEVFHAGKLLNLLSPRMLLLADRAFDTNDFLASVSGTGAQFLIRLTPRRRPAVLAVLPDGSYLTRLGTLKVRVIDADLTLVTSGGIRLSDHYRLATSLLDHRRDPADVLVRLYHERWEIESAYYALRHTLLDGRVLRSTDPVGLEQELWAQLALYQAVRAAMVEAVESVPGTDPDRASFLVALESARNHTITAHAMKPDERVTTVSAIGQTVLAHLLPKRRPRVSQRRVKAPMSRYTASRDAQRPPTSQNITSITIAIHDAASTPALLPTHQDQRRVSRGPGRTGDGPRNQTLQLMRATPDRIWQLREIAQALGYANVKSLAALLGLWTAEELLKRASRGFYTLAADLEPKRP